MIAAPRWTWLHEALTEAGVECEISSRGHRAEDAAFIEFRVPNGDWFCIHDQFYRKQWAGWTVFSRDSDGFTTEIIGRTKDQGEIVVAAKTAVGR